MSIDTTIREQGYQYFVTEAPELLQAMEQELLTLKSDYSLVKVHSLMRTTHTLKGAAANMGLETIKTVAHHLEDVFKALYNPDLVIDTELETLLLQGYECLRLPLMLEIQGGYVNDSEVLDRTVYVFAQLQEKLGDYFGRETHIPTSLELGFDITKSIFEVGVKQRLEELADVLNNCKPWQVDPALREQAEIFVGLAESLNLPGFGAIAQKTLAALDLHPKQAATIAKVALTDFWQGWAAVIAGDRTSGGEPSFTLQQLAGTILSAGVASGADEQGSGGAGERGSGGEEENEESIFSESDQFSSFLDDSETIIEIDTTVDFSEISLDPSLEDIFGSVTTDSRESSAEINSPEKQLIDTILTDVANERESLENREDSQLPILNSQFINPKSKIQNPKSVGSSVRVDLELLKRLSHLAGELLINQNRLANIAEQIQESVVRSRLRLRRHQQTMGELRDWSDQIFSSQERQSAKWQISNFKLQIGKGKIPSAISNLKSEFSSSFDSLELDTYSELHILLQSAIEEIVQLEEATDSTDILARQSSQIIEKQRRLLNNVQDDMREAQMLPVGEIFSRFPRLLEQLATAHRKPVELTLQGTDVLVDRALAEKLYDPLLHLVRNAFDHGIESPEIRCRRGKPETGNVEIRAYHRGNQTIIEVSDDGQGLDLDRIRRRAVELNWMSAEKANSLSENAVLDLLFEPGFSTVSQVSELSGRGIGLNVVRSQMQAVSGSVTVYSEPERGTTFSLQFPLTLTMAKLMVCEAGGAVYALLSDAVEQIIIPKSAQIQQLEGQKVLRWSTGNSQSMVPVYNMADLLGYTSHSQVSGYSPLLLLRQNQELLGLEVDQILGEQELVIRPLGKAIAPPSYVYGGSTLADGRLTLIIDGTALVDRLFDKLVQQESGKRERENTPALPFAPSPPLHLPSSSPKILVVDDSISVRQTLALLLQRAGYQVLQAQNGAEALQQMRQNRAIELVICDIEMPSMNGFEFLNHRRQEPDLAKVPVVMLTSRRGEKHRLISLEMGAVGYFTKPYREDELLDAIADLLNPKVPALVNS
ncbi:hybrid sensor histidine kinase/response regulator [Argonema antarcticum]|uniref:hybrid sensor histidine kinase/response regulator n=1 Tax=Argonema antarcticum TaxID=2942763 RepID=UPI00201250B1|nr:hybrid sensor histidine kinase/response regulator [Argonema antarcticum]MCL1472271.1 hybrid sensor histidine kinase/response regulator [Argonema antarcticum A004/B2]